MSNNQLQQVEAFLSHLFGIHVGEFFFNFRWAGSALYVQSGDLLVVWFPFFPTGVHSVVVMLELLSSAHQDPP